jgi:methyl-accepting chemotaxis protein
MNFTIKSKLIILAVITLLVTGFLAITSYTTNNALQEQFKQLNQVNIVANLDNMLITAHRQMIELQNKALSEKDTGVDAQTINDIHTAGNSARVALQQLINLKTDYLTQEQLTERMNLLNDLIKSTGDIVHQAIHDKTLTTDMVNAQLPTIKALEDSELIAKKAIADKGPAIQASVAGDIANANTILLFTTICAYLLLVPFITMIILNISRSIAALSEAMNKLAQGNHNIELNEVKRPDEIGTLALALLNLRKVVEKSTTLQTIVDNLSLPVMIADKNFIITYVNQASINALHRLERHLLIAPSQIIGTNVDVFYKDPNYLRSILSDRSRMPQRAQFLIGEEWLALTTNMLTDANNRLHSIIIDWQVITEQAKNANAITLAKESINNLIKLASQGNLNERIEASKFEGFYKEIAQSMNNLMDAVVSPINDSIAILSTLAKGDLTKKMVGNYSGPFAQIRDSINMTIDQLQATVVKVLQAVNTVDIAAGEISTSSSVLAERSEKQAAALELTAASIAELTRTVRTNSTNAKSANALASNAKDMVEESSMVVENAISAIQHIEQYSKKIADIVAVIDDIAFQANTLALNASVEAARAGEAGEGFAVIASEVRALAGRSASASKEINQLISESVDSVVSGASLVNNAGATLSGIISSVRQVADIVSGIANASIEQTSEINAINMTISEMDSTTQQNAALVEENSAAAQALVKQADSLKQIIEHFTIDEKLKVTANPIKTAEAVSRAALNKEVASEEFKTNREIAKPKAKIAASKKDKSPLNKPEITKAEEPKVTINNQDDTWEEF